MEKLSNNKIASYDFSKKTRGKVLADITNQALKNLDKPYKLPRGYKTEFIEFSPNSSTNAFGDEKNRKLYFSLDFLLNKEKFVDDIYNVTKEIRRLCQNKGKYDSANSIDKLSNIFTSTEDLKNMVTIEKSGNAGKDINAIKNENSPIVNQIEKDVEFYMLGKNFLSPKEKQSRKFALDFLKNLMNSLSNSEGGLNIEDLMDKLKEFISKKEYEENEKETYYTDFIKGVERDIINTMKVSQERLTSEIPTLNGFDRQVEVYKTMYGYDPIKTSAQSLALAYNDKLAKTLFNNCVVMDKNLEKYLSTCLDLIKYTDFTPSQAQIHLLNQACKKYNETCEENKLKIHPKKELKNFYNVKTIKRTKENTDAYERTQQM